MKQAKILGSLWGKSFATAVLTCYMTWGHFNLKMMLNAGVAAVAPLALTWLNPKDTSVGIGSK